MTDVSGAAEPATDIRSLLESGWDAPAPEPVITDAPAVNDDTPDFEPTGDDRPRDEKGRFAPKTAESAPAEAAPANENPDQGKVETPEPAPPAIQAPQSWSAAAKAKWATLPPDIQQEIAKREGDFSKGIEQKSLEAKKYDGLEAIIGPRRQAYTAQFGSVEKGLETLISISEGASRDPAGFMRWFAGQNGLDLAKLAEGQPAQNPELAPILNRLGQLEGLLTQQQQTQQQQTLQSLNAQVEAFAADPGNEHFNDVQEDVVREIPVIRAQKPHATAQEILKEAYERAIWANAGTREKILSKRQADEEAKRAQSAQAQASKAKAAALSLTGSPTPGAPLPSGGPAPTLRDELERQYARL